MRVFITGAAACLAKAVLPRLCELQNVESIYGIDLKQCGFTHKKLKSEILDIRSGRLAEAMIGYDAVVHLAFAVMKGQLTDEEMHENNVHGSLNVFKAAQANDIKKVINMSSVSVYGSGENLTEDAALKPNEVFTYAVHKAEIEREAALHFPNVTHLRAHLIFGPNAQEFLRSMCKAAYVITTPRPAQLQVVHEQDVAEAIVQALHTDATGPFNLAAPEITTLAALVRDGRKLRVPIPLNAIRQAVKIAKLMGSKDEYTWLDVMETTLTVRCERAREALQWAPHYTAWQAREAMSGGSSAANPA